MTNLVPFPKRRDESGGEPVNLPAVPDLEPADLEAVVVEGEQLGAPVDPPDERPTVYATVTANRLAAERKPIVPAWVRNADERAQVAKWLADYAWYVVRFHAARSPKYAGKTAVWAPVGLLRGAGRVLRWAAATEHTWQLMQHAATSNDPDAWTKINQQRERHTRWRWIVVTVGTLLLVVAVLVAQYMAAEWVKMLGLAVLVVLLARIGRPADRPITDRVSAGQRFTKLTAEMVRNALCAVGLAGIKEPAQIRFPTEIHRDGPGFLARVDLPPGVEAVDVIERRGKLSSALRLPVDQVWPAKGPDHAGQLDLWVGYAPASKMGQPRWSLCSDTARTSVFEPVDFGSDQRQRPVATILFERNFLIGGVPGSGKSYAARALALAAALDPICELKIAEHKGVADFGDLAPLCSTYVCGVSDEDIATSAEMLAWGLVEAERRGKRIRRAKERGEAPLGKVTPELAARPGSGLHPVLIVIDEAHEVFGDPNVGKAAADAATRLVKRGRALGLIVVLSTQIPDKDSLPPGITRSVNMRWCLAVRDYFANDAILGTGSYKSGITGTVFRPGLDAGWGIMTGLAEPVSVRSQFPSSEQAAGIVARATELRRGRVVGGGDQAPKVTLDVLRDVAAVFERRPGLHWEALAALLAERVPELYAGVTPDALSAMVRAEGVPSVDVKVGGEVRKGARLEAITAALDRRELR